MFKLRQASRAQKKTQGAGSLGVRWSQFGNLRGVRKGSTTESGLHVGLGVVLSGLDDGARPAAFAIEQVAHRRLGQAFALHDPVNVPTIQRLVLHEGLGQRFEGVVGRLLVGLAAVAEHAAHAAEQDHEAHPGLAGEDGPGTLDLGAEHTVEAQIGREKV